MLDSVRSFLAGGASIDVVGWSERWIRYYAVLLPRSRDLDLHSRLVSLFKPSVGVHILHSKESAEITGPTTQHKS